MSNVSEPVISFVELVKKCPGRFKVYGSLFAGNEYSYAITDKSSNEVFSICSYRREYSQNTNWMTDSEKAYVFRELTEFFEVRKDRLERLTDIRRERAYKSERKRLMLIYCKEE